MNQSSQAEESKQLINKLAEMQKEYISQIKEEFSEQIETKMSDLENELAQTRAQLIEVIEKRPEEALKKWQ